MNQVKFQVRWWPLMCWFSLNRLPRVRRLAANAHSHHCLGYLFLASFWGSLHNSRLVCPGFSTAQWIETIRKVFQDISTKGWCPALAVAQPGNSSVPLGEVSFCPLVRLTVMAATQPHGALEWERRNQSSLSFVRKFVLWIFQTKFTKICYLKRSIMTDILEFLNFW